MNDPARQPAPSAPALAARRSGPGPLAAFASVLRVLVIGLFLLTFVAQPFRIPSGSMEPTLQIGDFVLVSKTDFTPRAASSWGWGRVERALLPPAELHRGAIVVFRFPPDPSQHLVKRVVALPGEHVRLHQGRVFVNGAPLVEPYTMYTEALPDAFRDEFPNLREADPNINPAWWLRLRHLAAGGDVIVPPGHFFVLGDNRNNSEDSRYWGFVPRSMVVGGALLVYFAVPNGADAPEGGPLARLQWLLHWVHQRVGVPQ